MSLLNTTLYFLHVVAVVLWIGGIGYILFVLMPAVPKVALRDRATFMPIVLRRFLVVVWSAIAVLLLTGSHRVFAVWNAGQGAFWTSTAGHVLATKLVLVAALIGIALVVTYRTVPRARGHVQTHVGDPPDAYTCAQCGDIVGGMRRILLLALAVALVIIYLAVMLRVGW